MKIGIMSMQRVINYGSYMQALSLKKILEELGHEVVFVDYKAEPSIQHRRSLSYWLNRGARSLRNTGPFWAAANILRGRPVGYRLQKEYFAEELAFLPALKELGVDYEKQHYHTSVDALIIGSDEVFNCLQNADNVGYSMELFGKNNRAKILLSYAASFGNTTLERLKQYRVERVIGSYLCKFDAISVRDENSADIVRTLTGKEPLQHLDPALIGGIEKLQWEDCKERNYLAVYAYPNRISSEEGKEIVSFAQEKGLRILSLCGKQNIREFETVEGISPFQILSYIKNASYVVTDTFHGTIFSAICHVPFAVYCRRPENVSYSNSEKLLDLLRKLELMDRLVTVDSDLSKILDHPIEFERIDQIRDHERARSIEYIKANLEYKVSV